MNKRGFTLMEVLAVLLLLAVVVTLAVPGIRAARLTMMNSQSRAAAKKLSDAITRFRADNRGQAISYTSTDLRTYATTTNCTASTGIPGSTGSSVDLGQLFACGYLSRRDFERVPFHFAYNPSGVTSADLTSASTTCALNKLDIKGTLTLVFYGNSAVENSKYADCSKYLIYVDGRGQALEYDAT